MQTLPQKYRQAVISELTPHPQNPNQGDVGAIHTSIEANGFFGAVIVQKSSGHILAGNHRVIAAGHAGATKVPILEVDCDDETALRILLVDNRSAALAQNDAAALAELLTGLAVSDGLLGTGFDGDDVDDLLAKLQETGFPNADGNVRRIPNIDEQREIYENSNVRSVVLELSLTRFRWLVDALAALRTQYGMDANSDVVIRLVETASDTKAPTE